MFNPTDVVISSFQDQIKDNYLNNYSSLEPSYPGILSYVTRMSLEIIANSDAPYHDVNHTIMVTMVGQEILRGVHLKDGGVTPRDWLHFTISLLFHDIGYVRGICQNDRNGRYVIDATNETVSLLPGATDASLTPYHVERGKIFVRERFGGNQHIDVDTICANIEYTQFPVPRLQISSNQTAFPGFLRAADLIGQMADPNYMRKISALFSEFQETGTNAKLGYKTPACLRAAYPSFFRQMVMPHIASTLPYLQMTQEGKQWVANLYAHIFSEEYELPSLGCERASSVA